MRALSVAVNDVVAVAGFVTPGTMVALGPERIEDMVKTITGCNVTWRNTMSMNRLLCERLGGGAFPTPARRSCASASRVSSGRP